MSDKEKKNLIIFRIISLIIIIICLIVLLFWYINNKQNEQVQDELMSYVKVDEVKNDDLVQNQNENDTENIIEKDLNNSEENQDKEEANKFLTTSGLSVDFEKLRNINSDVYGWIKIDNTNIDFPIVKSFDNNYYLKKNFHKKYNGAGWIFADYRDTINVKNQIIYGHNRRNGSMFSNLKLLLNEKWFDNDNKKYFYYNTTESSYIAEIISVFKISSKNYSIPVEFENSEEFLNYIEEVKNRSIKDFNTNIDAEDNILTLCTCDDNIQNRIVITAKLIKK